MHVVIKWPDHWLAAARSEQTYSDRVLARLTKPDAEDVVEHFGRFGAVDAARAEICVRHDLPPDGEIRELWRFCTIRECSRCGLAVRGWVRVMAPAVLSTGELAPATPDHERRWESMPPAPSCPLCYPVDSLRVDLLSAVDRVRLLKALADHDDVAECLAVEADRAQARLSGETHERPRAPADVLRISLLESSRGFDRAALVAAGELAEFDVSQAALAEITMERGSARVVFVVPRQPERGRPRGLVGSTFPLADALGTDAG